MKNVFEEGNRYAVQSGNEDHTVLHFCLIALGVLAGMELPKKAKKTTKFVCGTFLLGICAPELYKVVKGNKKVWK
ncbi:MAG: hypothetical protein HUJ58_04345 [Erysipelotrichaceae bacterium]|nr:hypothetical protein [Erysipelotrichaceae bacterium]